MRGEELTRAGSRLLCVHPAPLVHKRWKRPKVHCRKLIYGLAATDLLMIMALHHILKPQSEDVRQGAKVWSHVDVCCRRVAHVVPRVLWL